MRMIERVAKALEDVTDKGFATWEEAARAAIEAMLDPTEEMMRAGEEDRWDDQVDFVWRAMVREALK